MLVLQRSPGESILIGDGPDAVVVTVVDIRPGGKVRLGVEARREIAVDRLEVRAAKDRNPPEGR